MPDANPAVPATAESVRDFGEHPLLDRIRARVPSAPPWVTVGIGTTPPSSSRNAGRSTS